MMLEFLIVLCIIRGCNVCTRTNVRRMSAVLFQDVVCMHYSIHLDQLIRRIFVLTLGLLEVCVCVLMRGG